MFIYKCTHGGASITCHENWNFKRPPFNTDHEETKDGQIAKCTPFQQTVAAKSYKKMKDI